MKLTPLILAASIATFSTAIAAKDDAAPKKPLAASPADAAWAEIETMLKGPKERPKSREDAMAMFKKHIIELDEKAAAFTKAHPGDPRRWNIAVNELQTNQVRGMVGLTPKSAEAIKKLTADILAAPDADKETKAIASFGQVIEAKGNEEEFKKLADAHVKAFPDFAQNRQIAMEIKKMDVEKELKSKPLDLKFAAVNGTEVDLAKMRGKVVLVDFWATWCGPCVAEIPTLVAAYDKLHPKGFEIIGISFDNEGDKDKLVKFTADKKMPWPQYFDGKGWKNDFGQKYGINSIPRMWLINKKGLVVDTNGREDLAAKVEKLLAE